MHFISMSLLAAAVLFQGFAHADTQRIGLIINAYGDQSSPAAFDQNELADRLTRSKQVEKVLKVNVSKMDDLSEALKNAGLSVGDQIARLYIAGPGESVRPQPGFPKDLPTKEFVSSNVGNLWFTLPPSEVVEAYVLKDGIENDNLSLGLKEIRGRFAEDAAIYIDAEGFMPLPRKDRRKLLYRLKHGVGLASRPLPSDIKGRGAKAYADALQNMFGLESGSIFVFRGRTFRSPITEALFNPFWRSEDRLDSKSRLVRQAATLAAVLFNLTLAFKGHVMEAAVFDAALLYGWSLLNGGFNRGYEYSYNQARKVPFLDRTFGKKRNVVRGSRRSRMDAKFYKPSVCERLLRYW